VVNDLPDLKFGLVFRHGDHRFRIKGYLTAAQNPAAQNPAAQNLAGAVAAVGRGKAWAERQGLVPAVAPAVAWVFGLRP